MPLYWILPIRYIQYNGRGPNHFFLEICPMSSRKRQEKKSAARWLLSRLVTQACCQCSAISRSSTQCLKITKNVVFENFQCWDFLTIFVQLKLTCLVTLFKQSSLRSHCRMRLFCDFQTLCSSDTYCSRAGSFYVPSKASDSIKSYDLARTSWQKPLK